MFRAGVRAPSDEVVRTYEQCPVGCKPGGGGPPAQGIDLVGHLAGFVVGLMLGAMAALPWCRRMLDRVPQWLAGAVALASIAIAWAFALHS